MAMSGERSAATKWVKPGFIENIYANQIAFGRLYRAALKDDVAAMGYETETVGKHGMWELKGVPTGAVFQPQQDHQRGGRDDASPEVPRRGGARYPPVEAEG